MFTIFTKKIKINESVIHFKGKLIPVKLMYSILSGQTNSKDVTKRPRNLVSTKKYHLSRSKG